MYSRCPGCVAVLRLTPAALAQAAGTIRCGNCGKTFNSLGHLYAALPESDEERPLPASGLPPLVAPVDADPESLPPESGPELVLDLEPAPTPGWARVAWPGLALILLVFAALQVAGPQSVRLPASAWPGSTGEAPPANPNEAIQIQSRDLHAHPSRQEAIVISALLVNQSGHRIDFPVIEVRLFDVSQQLIGSRRLEPAEYLGAGDSLEAGMRPQVLVPVVLELAVDASPPAGFQFRFH